MKYYITNARQQDFFTNPPSKGLKIRKIPKYYFTGFHAEEVTKDGHSFDAIVIEVNEDRRWYRVYYPNLGIYECFKYPEIKEEYSNISVSKTSSYGYVRCVQKARGTVALNLYDC